MANNYQDVTFNYELETKRHFLDLSVTVRVWEGEEEVRYFADGSGYPGCPPEGELLGVEVEWFGSDLENGLGRSEMGEWAGDLDRIALALCQERAEALEDIAIQEGAEW